MDKDFFIDLTMNENNIIYKRKMFEINKDLGMLKLTLMNDGNSYVKLDNIIIMTNKDIVIGNINLIFSSKISYPLNLFKITTDNKIKIDLSSLEEYGLGKIPLGLFYNSSFRIEIMYEGHVLEAYLNYSSIIENVKDIVKFYKIKTFDSDYVKSSSDVVIKNLELYNLIKRIEIYNINNNNFCLEFESILLMLDNIEKDNFNLEIDSNKIVLDFFTPVNFNNYENIKLAIEFKDKKERELVIISSFENDNTLTIYNGKGHLGYTNSIKNIRYLVKNNSLNSLNLLKSKEIIDNIDYKYI